MKRVIFLPVVFSLFLGVGSASANGICAGLSGTTVWGLCHAYCEAMECDTPNPNAAENACMVVRARFERIAGTPPPCECDLPGRVYTFHDPAPCLNVEWRCDPGYVRFIDDCGCGCEPG
jgi:hypothetical protein